MRRSAAACFCLGLVLSFSAIAEDWPGWRGPRGDGTSSETDIPTNWSATKNIAWKTAIPYGGHGSPIVASGKVFTVGCDPEKQQRILLAFDRSTGEKLWERTVLESPLERIHKLNSHASSTPAADNDHVYVSFLDGKNMCISAYSLKGDVVWQEKPGVFTSVHGYCSSPVLFENLVIVNGDHDGEAYLVALDRTNGKTVWKTPRENKTRSYCTPLIRDVAGKTQMILSGSKSVASFDPRTGKRNWVIDGPTQQFVASVIENHGLIFVTGGFPDKHIIAIDPSGSGNVSETHIRWRHQNKGVSYVPSPVAVGDYFLVVSDGGVGSCYEAETGKVMWQERLGGNHSASLVTANGLAYYLDDAGTTRLIRPGPTLDIVAENALGEECHASPALSGGQIFFRTNTHLICVGERK